MTRADGPQLARRWLARHKLPLLEDKDDVLLFRYQLAYFRVSRADDDGHTLGMALRCIYEAESPMDRVACLDICSLINEKMTYVKTFVMGNEVVVASEFEFTSRFGFDRAFEERMKQMVCTRGHFDRLMMRHRLMPVN